MRIVMTVMLAAAALATGTTRADRLWDEDTVIFYDNGVHATWWCSDRDSFGAAVRFTPREYPCEIVGARAEVGYDMGQQVYLRVFDAGGPGGLPGAVRYEERRLDIPRGQNLGFRDYDLTAPLRVDSGDFYLCFWQKQVFNLLFGTDTHFDSVARQWWFFPDLGWVTPMGMAAADHLIRAKVRYGVGVVEELGGPAPVAFTIGPNPVTAGVATLRSGVAGELVVYDAAGSAVLARPVGRGSVSLNLRRVPAGVYLARLRTGRQMTTRKLVIE